MLIALGVANVKKVMNISHGSIKKPVLFIIKVKGRPIIGNIINREMVIMTKVLLLMFYPSLKPPRFMIEAIFAPNIIRTDGGVALPIV
jgi:hypothetical protein